MTSDETTVTRLAELRRNIEQRDHDYSLHLEHVSNADDWTEDMLAVYSATVGGVLALIDEYSAALRSGSGIASEAPIHYPHCNDRCIHYLDNNESAPTSGDADPLREALEAIRDMEPEAVDESLPDHSECAECKRIKSIPGHVSTMCDGLYRAMRRSDDRWKQARQNQQWRMRDLARAALAAPPSPVGLDE